ncbi:MAG: ImmA/IrrE family metallo-endopeptidase [Candidatus Brocadiia bacterium]
MGSGLVPYKKETQIEQAVNEFRQEHREFAKRQREKHGYPDHHYPIVEVVDLDLKLDIMPLPGLYHSVGRASDYLAADQETLYIDKECSEKMEDTYRYTLAHEVSHLMLHRDLWDAFNFEDSDEYVQQISSLITDREYKRMEYQSNLFAGLLLVPANHLRPIFKEASAEYITLKGKAANLPPQSVFDHILKLVCENTAKQFVVDPYSIRVAADMNGMSNWLAVQLCGEDHGLESERRVYN